MKLALLIVAIILFVLASLGVTVLDVPLVPAGLAVLSASFLPFGSW